MQGTVRNLGRGRPHNMSLQLVGLKLSMLGSFISSGVHSDLSLGVKEQPAHTAVTPHGSELNML